MVVYVDQLVEYPLGTVKGAERVRYWCHMFADSLDELHEMAQKIGMRRIWFQGLPEHSFPHYDISKTRRIEAIKHGAVSKIDPPTLEEYRRFCRTQDNA